MDGDSEKHPARYVMSSRTASCFCRQLRIEVEGEPLGVGVCHCLACQQRTGSVFAALASFSAPFKVFGTATEFVREGDHGARFIFRFCPICGTTVFHTEEGVTGSVSIAVGAFTDPDFPPPQVSVYDSRRHPWVRLPPHVKAFEKDPL
ncbi:GFA family protein [Dyella sp. 20L07]|uniref:GFA family protein n=1 Tax=Dyella sp. 20L07 TaxID=3384240 RepID=UPI003D28DBEE